MRNVAEQICSAIKIKDVMGLYGVQFNHKGFASCPFHNEKTPSLTTRDNRYKCFGCGASGSVIDFVMAQFGITFQQAIIRLDGDFNLGLTQTKPAHRDQIQEAENRRIEEAYKIWQEKLHQDYLALCDIHAFLYQRVISGEEWLKEYQEKLEALLDTFDLEEARRWQTI